MEEGRRNLTNTIYRLHIEISVITSYEVDAVVNATNRTLLGGGRVDASNQAATAIWTDLNLDSRSQ